MNCAHVKRFDRSGQCLHNIRNVHDSLQQAPLGSTRKWGNVRAAAYLLHPFPRPRVLAFVFFRVIRSFKAKSLQYRQHVMNYNESKHLVEEEEPSKAGARLQVGLCRP